MLLDILAGGNIVDIIVSLLFSMPVILFALSMHETAHGYVAYKCGDNTAYNLGRLTLNPLAHLDLKGFLCMLIFGFGWAKPVPVNSRNFRNPKRGMALSALAGPLSNLLLGALCALLAGVFGGYFSFLLVSTNISEYWATVMSLLFTALRYSAVINFIYMVFNMIPVPPFDGSRIMLAFLPTNIYFKIMRYERQIMFGVLIALMVLSRLGFSPFSWIAYNLADVIIDPIMGGVFNGLI
jgi:Zn-dependent protease